MKRRLLLLALPLVLAALVFGVKWRADHPTLTKKDLEIRALMSRCRKAQFGHYNKTNGIGVVLFQPELKPFIDSFYVYPQWHKNPLTTVGVRGNFNFYFDLVGGKQIIINEDEGTGFIFEKNTIDETITQSLDPLTVRRWTELMLQHPLIGPELRARLK